jgi:hypothetical protein
VEKRKKLHLPGNEYGHFSPLLVAVQETSVNVNSIVNKEPQRFRLEVQGNIVEQVMKFKCVEADIIKGGTLKAEALHQGNKATAVSGR